MFKRFVLGVATFAIIGVAFAIYQWQDESLPRARRDGAGLKVPARRASRSAATRPGQAPVAPKTAFSFREAKIPQGEAPRVRVYDDKGNAKIVFQSTRWQPISDTEFHMVEPVARVLLPGGQLAYVQADEGQVAVQYGDHNNLTPKNGWLKGHVRVFIDRTTPQWREENRDLASPEQHPEAVVKIWLEDMRFNLDLNSLDSDGEIVVQSPAGLIEGRGLTLVWNELDRRVKLLRIVQGKRAVARQAGLVKLNMPGEVQVVEEPPAAPSSLDVSTSAPAAPVETTPNVDTPEPGERILVLHEPEPGRPKPKKDRIDTYQVVFRDNVVAEQKEGILVTGRVKADVLQMVRDFGRYERSEVEHTSGTRPAEEAPGKRGPGSGSAAIPDPARGPSPSTIEVKWTGELVVTSIEGEAAKPGLDAPPRFHLIAEGRPLEIFDRQAGDGFCQRLEYHQEMDRIWLTGTPEAPVSVQAGPHRRLMGEKIFFDRRSGLALIEGAGRMLDRRAKEEDADLAADVPGPADKPAAAAEATEEIEFAWQKHVEIQFGQLALASTHPETQAPVTKRIEYLKRAVFDGQAVLRQPGQSIAAEHIEATFAEPRGEKDVSADQTVAADHVVATGGVRLQDEKNDITGDRLEVAMTIDDTGRNVPKTARATGRVKARQRVARRGPWNAPAEDVYREITAEDEVVAELASVPKPITPQERAQLEAGAARKGIAPGSPEWLRIERRLRDRRETVITRMSARGGVRIKDPHQELDLAAEGLDCTLSAGGEIQGATIVGRDGQPARVHTGTFLIQGSRIILDTAQESVEVLGAGLLKFLTERDLDGRLVADPIPIAVTWDTHMALHGGDNLGLFSGAVRAVSENTILDCRDLRVEFTNQPKAPPPATTLPAERHARWILRPMFRALRKEKTDQGSPVGDALVRMRKRPSYLHAVGDAVILSSAHAGPQRDSGGLVSQWVRGALPAGWPTPDSRPAAGGPRRLLSRIRIAGPQIAVNLVDQHLGVEGPGNLLIEDYRLPVPRQESRSAGSSAFAGTAVADFGGVGPSQTLFTWQNAMTFLNHRNIAVFDEDVMMEHRAGPAMVLSQQLEAALKADTGRLRDLTGRRAKMTCGNLLVEFLREERRRPEDPSPLARATAFRSFQASYRVHLEESRQEGSQRLANGALVSYSRASGTLRVIGSPQWPAKISEQNEHTGRWRDWEGRALVWDQKNGTVEVEASSIKATGG